MLDKHYVRTISNTYPISAATIVANGIAESELKGILTHELLNVPEEELDKELKAFLILKAKKEREATNN